MAPLAKATGKPLVQGPKVNKGANPNGPMSKKNRWKTVKELKNEKETKSQGPHEVKKVIPPRTKLPMVDPSVPGATRKTIVPMDRPAVSGTESKDSMKKAVGQLKNKKKKKKKKKTKQPQGIQEAKEVIPTKTTRKTLVPMVHPSVSGTTKSGKTEKITEPIAHPAVSETVKRTQPGKDTTPPITLWTELFKSSRAPKTVVFHPEGGFCYPPLKGEYPDGKEVVEGKLSN
ncbi:uncharacterized protein TRUGW13939_09197 [Talaromyces rugulosus]|uniref:Uncharacterized protein n=1 Tax=Talaromyces rugulosus TaxID=121627 RepID=A0A7H8R8L6_TALRU|nr:uncharacterized protein TRUGW13939_09197 [Talaromyces rugulosus]QKX62041.1 hypothetical protein TRUGW13939_09197 [Talaromyces rugulosus]